jgi:hypothetical protein
MTQGGSGAEMLREKSAWLVIPDWITSLPAALKRMSRKRSDVEDTSLIGCRVLRLKERE